ncbi:hypothetical protein NE237_001086 [Protea cynaroides]|uniref:Uncharacterized protein n=1 Tax=Protea cynaroides TaxID=273540 RepID=A0A9Q0KSM8_9MAGN|nr:hypothetical protein NE237_001086 [Protea cynaroides]
MWLTCAITLLGDHGMLGRRWQWGMEIDYEVEVGMVEEVVGIRLVQIESHYPSKTQEQEQSGKSGKEHSYTTVTASICRLATVTNATTVVMSTMVTSEIIIGDCWVGEKELVTCKHGFRYRDDSAGLVRLARTQTGLILCKTSNQSFRDTEIANDI